MMNRLGPCSMPKQWPLERTQHAIMASDDDILKEDVFLV